MLFTDLQLADVLRRLRADASGLRSARVEVDTDPLQVVRAGSDLFSHATYFRTPDGDEVASLGATLRFGASGRDRFRAIWSDMSSLPPLTEGARLMLGFSFDPAGPAGVPRGRCRDGAVASDRGRLCAG